MALPVDIRSGIQLTVVDTDAPRTLLVLAETEAPELSKVYISELVFPDPPIREGEFRAHIDNLKKSIRKHTLPSNSSVGIVARVIGGEVQGYYVADGGQLFQAFKEVYAGTTEDPQIPVHEMHWNLSLEELLDLRVRESLRIYPDNINVALSWLKELAQVQTGGVFDSDQSPTVGIEQNIWWPVLCIYLQNTIGRINTQLVSLEIDRTTISNDRQRLLNENQNHITTQSSLTAERDRLLTEKNDLIIQLTDLQSKMAVQPDTSEQVSSLTTERDDAQLRVMELEEANASLTGRIQVLEQRAPEVPAEEKAKYWWKVNLPGKFALSPREIIVVDLGMQGKSLEQIAQILQIKSWEAEGAYSSAVAKKQNYDNAPRLNIV